METRTFQENRKFSLSTSLGWQLLKAAVPFHLIHSLLATNRWAETSESESPIHHLLASQRSHLGQALVQALLSGESEFYRATGQTYTVRFQVSVLPWLFLNSPLFQSHLMKNYLIISLLLTSYHLSPFYAGNCPTL